ncbi:RNA polymerase sigma factor [Methylomonas sp. HW2-6]|uniref:RNA polymerase sigma factor n=1 Tax=Methylomonas sp. HW2-6 TaxID=3376687 RepID=UPI004042A632
MPDQLDRGGDEYLLLQRIGAGDTAAFEAFYKIYYPRLFRFVLRMTRQTEGVEELIQETLLVVWERPHGFNNESKISTWVFGIAYKKTLKALAKTARRERDIDIDQVADLTGDPIANPADNWENQDWLNFALTSLSPEQRAVIELTFYHGLSYQEVAKVLDCPENTVKTRMFHARRKMQILAGAQEN